MGRTTPGLGKALCVWVRGGKEVLVQGAADPGVCGDCWAEDAGWRQATGEQQGGHTCPPKAAG